MGSQAGVRRHNGGGLSIDLAVDQPGGEIPLLAGVVEGARRDGGVSGAWSHDSTGTLNRGDSHCDFENRVVRAPSVKVGDLSVSGLRARAIRAHELGHIRFSPKFDLGDELPEGITMSQGQILVGVGVANRVEPDLLVACEELRVNQALMDLAEIDLSHLTDGMEAKDGQEAKPTATSWNSTLRFFVGTYGTPANKDFVKGVRKAQPEMAKQLTQVGKEIKRVQRWWAGRSQAFSTARTQHTVITPFGEQVVSFALGFEYSIDLAIALMKFWASPTPPAKPTEGKPLEVSGKIAEATGAGAGRWQELVFAESDLSETVEGALLKRRTTPARRGRSVRYPSRMLADKERRIFAGERREAGGVVFVDVSGSMSFGEDDLEALLDSAPMATVFVYSGKPNAVESAIPPNAVLLSWNGERVASVEDTVAKVSRNIGNCCDGPALDHAVRVAVAADPPGLVSPSSFFAVRKPSSVPVVWVCDGQLTDGTDRPATEGMMLPVAQAIEELGVIVAPSVQWAVKYLATGERPPVVQGRLGRYVSVAYGGLLNATEANKNAYEALSSYQTGISLEEVGAL